MNLPCLTLVLPRLNKIAILQLHVSSMKQAPSITLCSERKPNAPTRLHAAVLFIYILLPNQPFFSYVETGNSTVVVARVLT